jgi:TATA-binding protein-associated factor Taf7
MHLIPDRSDFSMNQCVILQGLMTATSCAADHQGSSDQKEDSKESDSEEEEEEEAELRRDVMAALEMVMKQKSAESSDSRAKMLSYGVMRQLRGMGHNAAICKSKWEKALGSPIIPAGNHRL